MNTRIRFELALVSCVALWVGCTTESPSGKLAERDFRQFRTEVYPVLLRDCGFNACHGSGARFLRVVGPGRVRLDPARRAFDLPTGEEVGLTYSLARSMIDAQHPERSLLLRKPLAIEAGGAGHFGADKFGRNVYRTVNDSGYLVLARWVLGLGPATN